MWFVTTALLAASALAEPPAGLDLEDPTPWEEASRHLLDGPPGCWEIVGVATWDHDLARWGYSRGSQAFVGRLDDGVWSGLHIESLGEVYKEGKEQEFRGYPDEQRFVPLLGQLPKAGSDQDDDEEAPDNIVRRVLRELQGEARYTWAKWDDAQNAVVYTEVIPVGDKSNAPEINVDTIFPEGGTSPRSAKVVFPERIKVKRGFPSVTAHNAVVELRGVEAGGFVFPAAEAYSAELHIMGFVFESAQTIRYKSIRPCPEAVSSAD